MPIYEYTCKSCSREFEELRGVQDFREPALCECGALADRAFRTLPTVFCAGDPNHVEEGKRYRNPDHAHGMSGTECDRRMAEHSRKRRELAAAAPKADGVRYRGSIPTELFYSKPASYWSKKENVAKHKDFLGS